MKEIKTFKERLRQHKEGKSYKDMVEHTLDDEGNLHIIRRGLSYTTDALHDEGGKILGRSIQYNTRNFKNITLEALFDLEIADHILSTYIQANKKYNEEYICIFLNIINYLIKQGFLTWEQFLDTIMKVKTNQEQITNLEQYKTLKRELNNIRRTPK